MMRKATRVYSEAVDFGESSDTVIDQLEAGTPDTSSPRRKLEYELARDKPTAAILPIYLREMGATPLINETKEVDLARELQESREAMAKLAMKLPAACKQYALEGDMDGPRKGREWPLDRLEIFYPRLLRYGRERGEPKVVAMVRSLKRRNPPVASPSHSPVGERVDPSADTAYTCANGQSAYAQSSRMAMR